MRTEYLFAELLSHYFAFDRALRKKRYYADGRASNRKKKKNKKKSTLINGSGTFNSRIAEVRIKRIV